MNSSAKRKETFQTAAGRRHRTIYQSLGWVLVRDMTIWQTRVQPMSQEDNRPQNTIWNSSHSVVECQSMLMCVCAYVLSGATALANTMSA